jgi:hypothetical protein
MVEDMPNSAEFPGRLPKQIVLDDSADQIVRAEALPKDARDTKSVLIPTSWSIETRGLPRGKDKGRRTRMQ